MAHYPLYCGVLHIIDFGLGILVALLVVIVHLGILYIERIYCHLNHRCFLSCIVYSVHCVRRFLPHIFLVFISLLFIFKEFITLFLSISSLFMLIRVLGCITFGIRARSSGLASAKQVILKFSLQFFFYKD